MDTSLAPPPKLAAVGLAVVRGGRTIVDVPRLDVSAGDVLAIVGPNGAGKSTLLLALALLERPTAGRVLFEGTETRGHELQLRRRMAVVFQEPLLLQTSVSANVEAGLRLRGLPARERTRRVGRWLERFGIAHLARRHPRTLSGGEAQRVSLARAFCLQPEVLFLDEPFSALDTPARLAITDDLAAVLGETGTTTLLVTHDHDEAARLATRVGVMIDGRIRQAGAPADVFGAPADPAVAAFVGIETIFAGEVQGRGEGLVVLQAAGHLIEALDARPFSRALVCLRPEDISIARPQATWQDSVRNHLAGRVTRIALSGSDARIDLDCGVPVRARITRRSLDELALAAGDPVVASFKATAVHLIPR